MGKWDLQIYQKNKGNWNSKMQFLGMDWVLINWCNWVCVPASERRARARAFMARGERRLRRLRSETRDRREARGCLMEHGPLWLWRREIRIWVSTLNLKPNDGFILINSLLYPWFLDLWLIIGVLWVYCGIFYEICNIPLHWLPTSDIKNEMAFIIANSIHKRALSLTWS